MRECLRSESLITIVEKLMRKRRNSSTRIDDLQSVNNRSCLCETPNRSGSIEELFLEGASRRSRSGDIRENQIFRTTWPSAEDRSGSSPASRSPRAGQLIFRLSGEAKEKVDGSFSTRFGRMRVARYICKGSHEDRFAYFFGFESTVAPGSLWDTDSEEI